MSITYILRHSDGVSPFMYIFSAKTPRVLAAEKRAKKEQQALKHFVASPNSSTVASKEQWEKAQAVPAGYVACSIGLRG
jgi:hypothetical protein